MNLGVSVARRNVPILGRMFTYVILGLGSVTTLIPFYWMLVTSFKVRSEVLAFPPIWIPSTPTLNNYVRMFSAIDVGTLYRNSLFISTAATVLMVFTSSLVGYVLGKFRFRGRDLLFKAIIATMIIPAQVELISLYLMIVSLKLQDTYAGVILPGVVSPYAIFLFRQFMYSIPTDLIDAARIDGAGEFYIFWKMVLPLSKPVLSTLMIFYFLWNWNDFLWPLVVLSSEEKFTLPVGLSVFIGRYGSEYAVAMAAASISIVPALVVFFIFQRQIVEGIALTGLRG